MLKKELGCILTAALLAMSGCTEQVPTAQTTDATVSTSAPTTESTVIQTEDETHIALSDSTITVNGAILSGDNDSVVYGANDIIYYAAGKDEGYGEGTEADAHTAEEASAHTVIHITKPGTYRVSGKLSAGQLFIDLGEDAESDPNAVVTLILDNLDISCTVAPAILFYNVYECGEKNEETASATVDTTAAGANVVIADGSVNTVNGAYVARIYKEGTTKKLHKYDGAFYSKMSMNIVGGEKGDGVLNINATNEGLDSELHLTIHGGTINITAQNDGINTNEDNISVTTINGGTLTINAGLGEEGDGIDSNGFLVINGGTVITSASDHTPDGGLDADRDILINGGTVIALGNQNGTVSSASKQAFLQISVPTGITEGAELVLADKDTTVLKGTAIKKGTALVLSAPAMQKDAQYTLTQNGSEVSYQTAGGFGMGGMQPPTERPSGEPGNRFPTVPEGLDEWLSETEIPDEIRTWIESMRDMASGVFMDKPRQG